LSAGPDMRHYFSMAGRADEREADSGVWPAQPPVSGFRPAAGSPSVSASAETTVRASDAERDVVLTELGEGFAQGRLSHETFVFRVEATLRARHRDELSSQLADLPPTRRGPVLRARLAGLAKTARGALDSARRPSGPPALVLPPGDQDRYTIGREWACDLSIGDMSVSRWHADLRRAAGGWRLADLGSLNGTRLNGWRIAGSVPVRAGDVVSFGTATFVLAPAPGLA
jgi:Domain of unknown function (DUF1707)/Inner membrane component of T3SS, cytoplasmic domain